MTTRDLARFAIETKFADLPSDVIHLAKRDIINVLGVALYSASDPSLPILLRFFEAEGGNQRATIWGTNVRSTMMNAALANGYTAHYEDFDDTHFPTIIHPSAPTVPAAFALAEADGATGAEIVAAVALGIEICCRVGVAMHPWHYDVGWHITGTTGVFGAAAAASRLHGLNAEQATAAFGVAGTQAAGVREVFGTMAKPMHAGRAAQAGILAAHLAKDGFTAAPTILEGRRGVLEVMSNGREASRLTEGLGERWELAMNGLKPYSCGVVSHPAIDAAVRFRDQGIDVGEIAGIDAQVHHLVPELMGRSEPQTGLEGKFSVQHTIACGLVDGAAGPSQFADAKVKDETLARLRRMVNLHVTEGIAEDSVVLTLTMADGSKREERVEHATGSPENPMSDSFLESKFLALASHTIGEAKARDLLKQLWRLDELPALPSLSK